MKYKKGDIVSGFSTSILEIIECNTDSNGYNYYQVRDIRNNIKEVEYIDIYLLEHHTELDKTYLRKNKLTKIINRIK